MRPVMHGDVLAAARALLAAPAAWRARELHWMLAAADAADLYRRTHGQAHPLWGNGSLMAVAMERSLPPEPPLDDPDYCRCLADVFETLVEWRATEVPVGSTRVRALEETS